MHPLSDWTYFALAAVVMIEGPIATLLAAVGASAGYFNPYLVFLAAGLGNLTADILWYTLGYLGKLEWLTRYGRWVGVRREQVLALEHNIQKHNLKILFIAKLTLGFIIPVLVATGLARVPWRRWFGVLFLGECIWTGTLVLVGYHLGGYIKDLEAGLQIVALVGTVVFMLLMIRIVTHRQERSTDMGE